VEENEERKEKNSLMAGEKLLLNKYEPFLKGYIPILGIGLL